MSIDAAGLDFHTYCLSVRLHSGDGALGRLSDELRRSHSSRAIIVCGRSVSRGTTLIEDMRTELKDRCVGVFDEAARHAEYSSVMAAVEFARSMRADAIIAVGGGSVMMFGRMVAILLAEGGDPTTLMTQYVEGRPAVSPKLDQPKLPIFNVPTVPTNAQFHAGSAMKNQALGHRMEYFDPKTRPVAIFWDPRALATAPPALAWSSGLAIFFWSMASLCGAARVPLLDRGDLSEAMRLTIKALPRLRDASDPAARVELSIAAFLQYRGNGASASGARVNWPVRITYALSAGIFNADDTIEPGIAYLALFPHAVRVFGDRCIDDLVRLCRSTGADFQDGDDGIPERAADHLMGVLARLGVSARLRDIMANRDGLADIKAFALKNFNADPKREFLAESDRIDDVIEAAW